MRYGRRRRGFPWGRAAGIALAAVGALALLLVSVNWRSAVGLYRINRVGAAVQSLEGAVRLAPWELRNRDLAPGEAVRELERGLRDLGLNARLAVRPQGHRRKKGWDNVRRLWKGLLVGSIAGGLAYYAYRRHRALAAGNRFARPAWPWRRHWRDMQGAWRIGRQIVRRRRLVTGAQKLARRILQR